MKTIKKIEKLVDNSDSLAKPSPTDRFRFCNHHHELTDEHVIVNFGDGDFVANNAAVPLLKALNEIGLQTRTHHVGPNNCFISILLNGVEAEFRIINEKDADRTKYNGMNEILLRWSLPILEQKQFEPNY